MKTLRELFVLLFYLTLAVFLTYQVSATLSRLFFPLFLILFYKSKKNYLWLAFFFIILVRPGGLFSGSSISSESRLPIYTIIPGISIGFDQLFVLTALIKALKCRVKFNPIPFLKQNLKRFGLYFLFLSVFTVALGISYGGIERLFKISVKLTLFYSIFFLLREEKDFVSFFRLIFPFAFIAFVLQLYSLSVGHQLITVFKPDVLRVQGSLGNVDVQRPCEMSEVLFLSFFGSLYFLANSRKHFEEKYLLLVNIVSFFSVFITATRGWVVAFTVSYVLFFLFDPGKSIKRALKYSLILLTVVILLFSFSLFKNQFFSAMGRVRTVELLLEGDITADGTVRRYDVRAPNVLNAFKESNILFGAGFSDHYFFHQDGHIGFLNFLFNSGIIGIILLGFFLYGLIRYPLAVDKKLEPNNPYKGSIKIFPIVIIALILLNGMTQFFGYDVSLARTFSIAIILFFLNNQISNALSHSLSGYCP